MLRQWLDECRNLLRQKRKIENAAKDWQASGQKTDYLLSKKRLKEAKDFQKEQKEKYPLAELAASFVAQSSKHQRRESIKFLGLFLIIPLIGTAIGGYFVVRELLLNADKTLIQNCEGKEYCHGRIQALERLVEAKRSLKSYNLVGANLSRANLSRANLSRANLESANLESAYLIRVQNLTFSQIKSACYWEKAIYKGNWDDKAYKWQVYEEANQEFIKQLKQDKASDPKKTVDCSRWE